MLRTKNKTLAQALVKGKSLEFIKELAKFEMELFPRRNCNFEREILELENEQDLELFIQDLKDIERTIVTYYINDKKVIQFDSWNNDGICFQDLTK